MSQDHLNQIDLARRWKLSHRTLERWRYTGQGPAFLKLGGRVLYRREDVEAFEQNRLQLARAAAESVRPPIIVPRRRLTAVPPEGHDRRVSALRARA